MSFQLTIKVEHRVKIDLYYLFLVNPLRQKTKYQRDKNELCKSLTQDC
ncbi:hypothetical protein Xets_01648 [Xenorhabdus sp. TS4]|nr:hypothetical protein [Xenorhabdus sp. TS4]